MVEMSKVKEFYTEYGIKEWKRLEKDSFHMLETHFKTCEIPSVADMSLHMMVIARK